MLLNIINVTELFRVIIKNSTKDNKFTKKFTQKKYFKK